VVVEVVEAVEVVVATVVWGGFPWLSSGRTEEADAALAIAEARTSEAATKVPKLAFFFRPFILKPFSRYQLLLRVGRHHPAFNYAFVVFFRR
jgi:hypothetical protein